MALPYMAFTCANCKAKVTCVLSPLLPQISNKIQMIYNFKPTNVHFVCDICDDDGFFFCDHTFLENLEYEISKTNKEAQTNYQCRSIQYAIKPNICKVTDEYGDHTHNFFE